MNLNFSKSENGLIPAIILDYLTGRVLMLGFMNEQAFTKTLEFKRVTFFSRTKNRLWTKGEESGNYLELISYARDCDADTLLIYARPAGPVCHTGSETCFDEHNRPSGFLGVLEQLISERKHTTNIEASYTANLFKKGINKIAQKVGEEATELVIESKDNNRDLFLNEAADLLFHYLILLQAKDVNLKDVISILEGRHKN